MYRAPIASRALVVTAASGNIVARNRRNGAVVWRQSLASDVAWATRLHVGVDRVVVYGVGPRQPSGSMFVADSLTSVLVCFAYETGAPVWGKVVDTDIFAGTLVVDEDQIFLADGVAIGCWSLSDGTLLWRDTVEGAAVAGGRVPIAVALPGVAEQGDQR